MKFPSGIPTLNDLLLTILEGAISPDIKAEHTSRTWTTGRHGVPSLKISIFPVVNAHATRLLKTISHLNRGLAPNTVDGLKHVTMKSSLLRFLISCSASHLAFAYAVTGFFSLSSSFNS